MNLTSHEKKLAKQNNKKDTKIQLIFSTQISRKNESTNVKPLICTPALASSLKKQMRKSV